MRSFLDRAAPAVVVLLALVAVGYTLVIVSPGYVIDDAFIGFRYARNLAEGHGLVFNPGVSVEGYTSFLWVMISWLGIVLGFEAIDFVQGVSVLSQIAIFALLYRMGRRMGRSPAQSLVAPVLLACHVTFLTYPMTGMDSVFFSLLVTLAVFLLQRGYGRRDVVLFGLALSAIVLTRFDGFLMAGILLAYVLLVDRRIRDALPAVLMLVAVLAAYNGWRLATYPSPFPNTFYAKMVFDLERLFSGVVYCLQFLVEGQQYLLILVLVPFALGPRKRDSLLMGWVVAAHFAYVVFVGGDWMQYFRFVLPVLPLLLLLAQEGAWTLYDLAEERLRSSSFRRAFGVLGLAALVLCNGASLYKATFAGYRPFLSGLRGVYADRLYGGHWTASDAELVGRHLEERLPQDYWLAAEWAGVIPYYIDNPVLDIFGLNDEDAVKHDFPTSSVGTFITADYLRSRAPEVVVVLGRLYGTREEAIEHALARMHETPADTFGGKWVNEFYGVLDLPEYGYRLETMEIHGHHWPYLLRGDLEPL